MKQPKRMSAGFRKGEFYADVYSKLQPARSQIPEKTPGVKKAVPENTPVTGIKPASPFFAFARAGRPTDGAALRIHQP